MNNNINLTEILKDCPEGTELYSPIFGEVKFFRINDINDNYPIVVIDVKGATCRFDITGKLYYNYDNAECTLFPSKDQRDWSKFKPKKSKFDPKTLQPFDKVLVRTNNRCTWEPDFFGYIDHDRFMCVATGYAQCIPYNNETKHLVGINEEAPEYYRYWED